MENTQTFGAEPKDASANRSGGAMLLKAGLAAAAAVAVFSPRRAAAQATGTKPSLTFNDIPGTGDIKVLNYALALEALEADLYSQALKRLTTGGDVNGVTITGLGLSDSQPDVLYTRQFGRVEAQHRDFLNRALGDLSIIGTGANGVLRTAQFDFGIGTMTREQVVSLLYTVENTGVSAYLGAIPSFVTKNYLAVAGGIQATEARHTAVIAAISNQLFGGTLPTAPLARTNNGIDPIDVSPNAVLAIVSGPNGFIVLPAAAV